MPTWHLGGDLNSNHLPNAQDLPCGPLPCTPPIPRDSCRALPTPVGPFLLPCFYYYLCLSISCLTPTHSPTHSSTHTHIHSSAKPSKWPAYERERLVPVSRYPGSLSIKVSGCSLSCICIPSLTFSVCFLPVLSWSSSCH